MREAVDFHRLIRHMYWGIAASCCGPCRVSGSGTRRAGPSRRAARQRAARLRGVASRHRPHEAEPRGPDGARPRRSDGLCRPTTGRLATRRRPVAQGTATPSRRGSASSTVRGFASSVARGFASLLRRGSASAPARGSVSHHGAGSRRATTLGNEAPTATMAAGPGGGRIAGRCRPAAVDRGGERTAARRLAPCVPDTAWKARHV
jgi:hypothetical protein